MTPMEQLSKGLAPPRPRWSRRRWRSSLGAWQPGTLAAIATAAATSWATLCMSPPQQPAQGWRRPGAASSKATAEAAAAAKRATRAGKAQTAVPLEMPAIPRRQRRFERPRPPRRDRGDQPDALTRELERLNEMAEAGRLSEAHEILCGMDIESYDRKKRMVFNTAIKACANAGNFVAAELYYKAMLRMNIRPNAKTFGKLMEASAKAGNLPMAKSWLQEMQRAGFAPSEVSINIMMDAAARAGDYNSSLYYMRLGQELGFELNTMGVNSIIDAAVRNGDRAAATAWFDHALGM